MTERVKCGWAGINDNRFPDSQDYHRSHGDDLHACDAWVCSCGNSTDTGGFESLGDKHVTCNNCSCIYTLDGERDYDVVVVDPETCSHSLAMARNYKAGDVECERCGALWERRR